MACRHPDPEVRGGFGRLRGDPDRPERLDHEVPPAPVDLGHLLRKVARVREGSDGRTLERVEHARVEIRLQLPVALDDLGVAGDPADATAGHVPALGARY